MFSRSVEKSFDTPLNSTSLCDFSLILDLHHCSMGPPSFYRNLPSILAFHFEGGESLPDTYLISPLGELQGVLQVVQALFRCYILH